MSKILIELESAQLEKALTRLGAAEQLRLAKHLAVRHMEGVVAKLRRTVRRKGLSTKALAQIVEQTRCEVHRRSRH